MLNCKCTSRATTGSAISSFSRESLRNSSEVLLLPVSEKRGDQKRKPGVNASCVRKIGHREQSGSCGGSDGKDSSKVQGCVRCEISEIEGFMY